MATKSKQGQSTKLKKVELKMKNKDKSNQGFVALMAAVAFAYLSFGAITNVAGAIIPKIRETYNVSASLSAFLAATFFIAYGITSIPWGMFMEKNSKKVTLISSSLITTAGVLLFAAVLGFMPNMIAMFLCGVGITGIQVALNPLVAEISDPAKYSRNLTMFMVINGAGGFSAPLLVSSIENSGLHWSVTYWVFTGLALIMTLAISFPKYPKAETNDQDLEARALEPSEVSGQSIAKARSEELSMRAEHSQSKNLTLELLTSNPLIYIYALGIFLYVGVEVGIANTIGLYFQDQLGIFSVVSSATDVIALGSMGEIYSGFLRFLHIEPSADSVVNLAISCYWGGLLFGRFIGTAVLDKISGRLAIKIYITLAAVSLYMAMSGDINQALIAFPLIGFFISIMFPTIYSLATNSFPKEYSSAISGILCTAIIGGAVIGPVIAAVAEANQGAEAVPNWDTGLLVAFACYAYIFVLGLVKGSRPNNPTL